MRVAQSIGALLCAAALVSVSNTVAAAEENEIFKDLMKDGITLSDGTKADVPKVVMEDGLSADAQAKVMENCLADKKRLANFRSGDVNAWFELKISGAAATPAKPSAAKTIDLFYVVNGRLETMANKGFIKGAMGEGGGNFHILTDQELKDENITPATDTPTKRERYAHAKMDLFNMANIRATGQGISLQNKDSVLIAFRLDPKFEGNKNFPNQWTGITRNAAGVKVATDPQPYRGAGGYMKLTRVVGSAIPQVFIEYHLVFDEPYGWFEGKPVLTSKLPTKVDADVRSFRKDIIKFEKANPPQPAAAQANAAPAAKK